MVYELARKYRIFTQVYVFKPTASKPGNSEVYVVCEDYRGVEHSLLLKLTELVGTNEEFRLPRSIIPETFMAAHRDCCRYFSKLQAQTIQMNLDLYNRESRDWLEGVMAMRIVCAKQYLEENDIRPIHSHQKILQRERKPDPSVLENGVRHALPVFRFSVSGSYNQRCANATLTWREKMRDAEPYDVTAQMTWLEMADVVKPVNGYGLQLTLGKPVHRIHSSRYAHQQILDDYNAMLENAEHLKPGDGLDSANNSDWSAVYGRLWESLTLRPTDVQCRSTDALHQKESSFIQYGTSHFGVHADYRFLLMDVTATTTTTSTTIAPATNNELTSKHELMRSVIEAMKVLEAGDCLVGRVFTALSRYTASIVYLLKIMFYKVTITTLDDHSAPGYCYVVCCGFLGVDNCLVGRLTRAVKHADALLQLVPTDWLEYYPFRQKLTEMNRQIILSHLNRLIIRERDFVK